MSGTSAGIDHAVCRAALPGRPASGVAGVAGALLVRLRSPLRLGLPAPLLLSAAALFWAGNFVTGRAVHGVLDPLSLNFWRWAFAAAALLPLARQRLDIEQARLLRAHWRLVLALACTGVVGFNTVIYAALARTPAVNALLIFAATPAVVALLARTVLGERCPVTHRAGIALSMLGVAVLVASGDPASLLGFGDGTGDAIALAGVLIFAAYTVLLRRRPPGLDPLALLAATVAVGLVLMLPAWICCGARLPPAEPPVLLALAYLGLCASVLGFLAWTRGVGRVGPARAGVYLNLTPVFGTCLAVALLGEAPSPHHLAGGALVLAGLLLPGLWGRGRAAEAAGLAVASSAPPAGAATLPQAAG
jgi:drug/metabolite transporter (DMT)-like permease